MMEQIRGSRIILNGTPADASEYLPDAAAGLYYEVIRVMRGKFLFLDDHLARLQRSCMKSLVECPGPALLKEHLHRLLENEKISEGNVKVVLYRSRGETHTASFFIPHYYPTASDYGNGVTVKTFSFTRPDPTIKRWNERFRSRVNDFIREENIYEAILVNEAGFLTEGSRSNLFFTGPGDSLTTAPGDMILPGITRNYVIGICRELGISISEKPVTPTEAPGFRGCFISGTSPKVLPVKRMDELLFDPRDPVILKIMHAFDLLVSKIIDSIP